MEAGENGLQNGFQYGQKITNNLNLKWNWRLIIGYEKRQFFFVSGNPRLEPYFNLKAQSRMIYKTEIAYAEDDFPFYDPQNKSWEKASDVKIDKYWSGEPAPPGRHFKTRLLWSDAALYVRFEAAQSEPLVVSAEPNLQTKTRGLWDRDVCEIFLAPSRAEFRKYFEFEVAPTGEWIDLGIHQMPDKRETDWDYASGMQSFAEIEKAEVRMAIRIEWRAFGVIPKSGDVWLGNIYRCVGASETRGYLAWSPTETPAPAFHVPEKFGEFKFVK
jgi:hypothetical protein